MSCELVLGDPVPASRPILLDGVAIGMVRQVPEREGGTARLRYHATLNLPASHGELPVGLGMIQGWGPFPRDAMLDALRVYRAGLRLAAERLEQLSAQIGEG